MTVYGYRMATGEAEQLDLWLMFASAMEHRCPVRVSFFKRKKDDAHKPVTDRFGNPVYVRVTRVVEPHELTVTRDGRRIVKVVDRAPEGVGSRPEYRTIRLDRVAVRYSDSRPFAQRMLTHGFLCPSLLDGKPLHPTKRVLAAA
jgi:hypothetical protein